MHPRWMNQQQQPHLTSLDPESPKGMQPGAPNPLQNNRNLQLSHLKIPQLQNPFPDRRKRHISYSQTPGKHTGYVITILRR